MVPAGADVTSGAITRVLREASAAAVSRCRESIARCSPGKVRTSRTIISMVNGHHTLALTSSRVKRSMNRIPWAPSRAAKIRGYLPGLRPVVGRKSVGTAKDLRALRRDLQEGALDDEPRVQVDVVGQSSP